MTMDFFGRAQQHKGIHTKKEKTNMVRHIQRHVSMLLLWLTCDFWALGAGASEAAAQSRRQQGLRAAAAATVRTAALTCECSGIRQ